MPRAPVAGREIRRRSRNGCWNCKARKVKCGEEKPRCSNCERLGDECDYKIRLSWGGRPLKKKQMLNGEEQTEDESMFLPGAGQFSIHQPFQQPQSFAAQPANDGAASRKSPPTKPGRKTNGITSFQNVFAVAEAPLGLGPVSPTPTSPEEVPRGSSHGSSSPPTRQGSQTYFPWPNEQDQTPTHSAIPISNFSSPPLQNSLKQEPLEPDTSVNDRSRFGTHVLPISTSFSPPAVSSAYSKPNLPNPLSPPYSQYSPQSMMPQYTHHSHSQASPKAFHPPPRHISSPPKRIRRSSSPPLLPTPPPSFYNNDHYHIPPINNSHQAPSSSMMPHFEFVGNNPFTQASMHNTAQEYGLVVPSLAPPPVNTQVRRLSVASMLASDDYYYPRSGETTNGSGLDYAPHTVSYGITTSEPNQDDEEVEEIPRYDLNAQAFGEAYRYRMNAASTYYPQIIGIPKGLDPLPDLLIGSGNEKNMLYFKHFLEFTARLLVPHDCSENPFKKVLPQMAVGTDKLMNLLLAYSASHRARLCSEPEPTDRINEFLSETITDLNKSLQDDQERTSDSTLATLIMLCSYDIISPNKLISWRKHLNAARGIILSRGETEGIHCRDKVSYFLVRWFAYLDVLGSLSGRDNDQPLFSGKYWIHDETDESEDSAVDCVLGFTSKCVSILAKIGELARKSDQLKKIHMEEQVAQVGPGGNIKPWTPPPNITEQARKLEDELIYARSQAGEVASGQYSCEAGINGHKHNHHHHAPHSHHNFEPSDQVNEELMATNDAFHLAASVHLYRRVLNYPSAHPKVQRAVGLIVGAMHKVRHNGEAENCLLFPLFTAGCEAIQPIHRTYTLKRMQAVEKIGMTQVTAARRLMERVWAENVPWETLSDGEFIG